MKLDTGMLDRDKRDMDKRDIDKIDKIDRQIINQLQAGFPICPHPYAQAAHLLGLSETALLNRLQALLDRGILSRFGPLYAAERLGGGLSLCAVAVPEAEVERVAAQINAFPQVAHHYQRDHDYNLWFVLATETPAEIDTLVAVISTQTGYPVLNLPKLQEYYLGFRLEV